MDSTILFEQLNAHLINTYGLSLQAQRSHWDVVGPTFGPLHSLFQEAYDYLSEHIDNIAERQRQLGYFTTLTLADLAASEYGPTKETYTANELVMFFNNNLTDFIQEIRNLLDMTNPTSDYSTTNWLSGVIQDLEKLNWKFNSSLEVTN